MQAPYRHSAISRRFNSLSGRLLLSLLAAHLLLAPLLVVFVLNAAAQNYKDRFIDQARSDAQWVQTLLGTLSPGVDRQMLLDDLVLNTFRQSIQLFNTHHQRLARAGAIPESSSTSLHEDFEFGQHNDAVYWIELPLNTGADNPASTLLLGYDETPIADDISRLYTHSLQLAALYLALMLTLVVAFSRYLASALKQLGTAAHRIATGRYYEKFRLRNTATEIIELADDLENMREELVNRGQQLGEQRQYLRTLLDHIAEGVVTFNQEGIIQTCNPAALNIFTGGTSPPEGLKITDWLPDFHLTALPDSGDRRIARQYLGRRQDGEFITIEFTLTRVEHKGHYEFLALIRDISEHKRLEEERRRHREDLAHARRLSSLGEMAAGLAHELNQPLAAINLYIQGSLRRLAAFTTCPPEIRASLENASKQAQRAGDIISQIRGFVKKAPAENMATDINRLIRETLLLVEAELTNAAVTVHLDLAKNLPPLTLDRLQIQQALINLVSNGIDAMETTKTEHKQLTIQTRQTGSTVTIAIEDRGSGIPEALTDQLFTPFASGKATGMGLGLAISRSIAEEHGGQLNFTARAGGGSIFILTLPITETPHTDNPPTGR